VDESKLSIYDLEPGELLMLREQVDERSKSGAATWLLWFFLGGFGGHRFYLGDYGRAIGMLLTLGGLGIWALVDAFFIPKALRKSRRRARHQVLLEISAMRRRKAKAQREER